MVLSWHTPESLYAEVRRVGLAEATTLPSVPPTLTPLTLALSLACADWPVLSRDSERTLWPHALYKKLLAIALRPHGTS